ncbi:hypothetical protein [Saccharopolyspora shandongensis]|uniref:hypothetical protein n=1 Tax=Saccharopolyspora shandongensis TaxID=418495 RepID=UPI003410011A
MEHVNRRYEQARQETFALMDEAASGSFRPEEAGRTAFERTTELDRGGIAWTREELYDR